MKLNKKYLLIPLLSFLCLTKVYADCSQDEIDEFKKIEDDYNITATINLDNKQPLIIINNPEPKKFGYQLIQENGSIISLHDIKETEVAISNILPGAYTVEIIGLTNTCNSTLRTETLTVFKYNKYSEDQLCKGNEEFYLCQVMYDTDIDYETFKSRLELYIKNKNTSIEDLNVAEQDENIINKTFENIINFLTKYYVVIIISIVCIVIMAAIITALSKSLKKKRRLE